MPFHGNGQLFCEGEKKKGFKQAKNFEFKKMVWPHVSQVPEVNLTCKKKYFDFFSNLRLTSPLKKFSTYTA